MAVFCALCMQPGINLPENWREYEIGFMMDGNFQAEHMKMRNPENDVPLSKGTGFMVSRKPYELHLQSAIERQQGELQRLSQTSDNLKLKLVIGLFHIHDHQKHKRNVNITSLGGHRQPHEQLQLEKLVNLELTEKEISASGHERHATWIGTGLKIQEMQVSLQALVRKIGSHFTPDQQREVAVKQAQLQERVDTFHKQAANILQAVSEGGANSLVMESYVGTEFNGIGKEDDDNVHSSSAKTMIKHTYLGNSAANGCVDMEYISLHLPSHFRCNWCNKNAAKDLAKAELRLGKGQLSDSLHHIRIALGYKSYLFRHDVHPAHMQKLKTHAWEGVHAVE
ncbi:hypothetical protein EI94DRAFT_1705651 [Lactarius quietus]|nr:hypothetical protein EI94DRAFT_1705651 [Lactarius quietus]